MKFYHATSAENMKKILEEQRIKKTWNGIFLCHRPIDACKFLVIRGMKKISVIEIELNEKDVHESYDHAESFFKCKAYVYDGNITLKGGENIYTYEVNV